MVGGGALFCELYNTGVLHGHKVYLSDAQPALIQMYSSVKQDWESVHHSLLELLASYNKKPETTYSRLRDAWNSGDQSAARFIFLKQTAFNGLWRENRQGAMNVPWGRYEHPKIPTAAELKGWSTALRGVRVVQQDFEAIKAQVGDIVYFDPPYYKSFDKFTKLGFDHNDQIRLIKFCRDLCELGAAVLYSNVVHTDVVTWLQGYWVSLCKGIEIDIIELTDSRSIAGSGQARAPVPELLAVTRQRAA